MFSAILHEMKQVIVIHGGRVFESHDEYLSYLQNYKIESLEYFKKKSWKSSLEKELGVEYDIVLPKMPCKENAKYSEWKIWFQKIVPLLEDDVILVGHSLGGIFLAKYLSEEMFAKKILATILVAAPFNHGRREHIDFTFPGSLAMFEQQGGKIILYHSKDDLVVAFSELAKYQEALPHAKVSVFENRGHFNQENFPEIITDIRNV